MIHKPNEINVRKRFRMLLYGVPGIAKSTTALSAPSPLMVDTDRGWDRIPVNHRRGDFIQPDSYQEIIKDLTPEMTKPYETIIFDTGGSLLNLMKVWAISTNPQNGQKDGITLSQKGYGVIGHEFARLMDFVYYQLGKHVVLVIHAKEDADADQKCYRLDIEGQARNNSWKPVDLGGFMEAVRDKRVIGFSPTDRYFAKGTHGIEGQMEIPNVMLPGVPNDFITNLFNRVNQNIKDESVVLDGYNELTQKMEEIIGAVDSLEKANDAVKTIKDAKHFFASKLECWHKLKNKAEASGYIYDKKLEAFVVKES